MTLNVAKRVWSLHSTSDILHFAAEAYIPVHQNFTAARYY